MVHLNHFLFLKHSRTSISWLGIFQFSAAKIRCIKRRCFGSSLLVRSFVKAQLQIVNISSRFPSALVLYLHVAEHNFQTKAILSSHMSVSREQKSFSEYFLLSLSPRSLVHSGTFIASSFLLGKFRIILKWNKLQSIYTLSIYTFA